MHNKSSHLKAIMLFLILSAGMMSMAAQEVSIKGSVINPNQQPVGNVKVYLKSNPSIYCYSDSNGLFQLSSSPTSATALVFNERISVNPDGSLQIHALQNSLSIDIYDLLGRRVKEVIHRENLNGIYRIHPGAYLNDLPGAIYIAQVRVDEYSKGIKISNLHAVDIPTGLTRIADYEVLPEPALKSEVAEDDTLIFFSDFYRKASLAISSYSNDVGVIQLENFGDYTVAEGMDLDKTQIDRNYGGFLQLTSAKEVEFTLVFDSLCCFSEELIAKAIPISELDFLSDNLEFISGIHLEPSGTELLVPPEVWIKLPGLVSDSLVVFGYSGDSNEIYYMPYYSYTEGYYGDNPISYLQIYISHFSGIGVASGMIPDNTESETKTSQDYVSDLAFYQQQNEGIPTDVWTDYYDGAILSMFEGIASLKSFKQFERVNSLEDLKQVVQNMLEYMFNRQVLGADTDYQNSDEYADFLSILTTKINGLYNEYNELCTSSNDDCVKYQQGKKAAEVLEMGQLFGLQDSIPDIHDFCSGEMVIIDSGYFDQKTINLYKGRTHILPYEVYNMKNEVLNEKIIWTSENPSIASVDQHGLVTAIGAGTTIIKGSWCDVKNQVTVLVTNVNCETEFCKFEECANGKFAGRGVLKFGYEGYSPGYVESINNSTYFVEFSINLNPSYLERGYTVSGSYRSTTRSLKYGETEWSIRHSEGDFYDSNMLNCFNYGFDYPTANPISIKRISYFGSTIRVIFGRITVYGDFYTLTKCVRIGQ